MQFLNNLPSELKYLIVGLLLTASDELITLASNPTDVTLATVAGGLKSALVLFLMRWYYVTRQKIDPTQLENPNDKDKKS